MTHGAFMSATRTYISAVLEQRHNAAYDATTKAVNSSDRHPSTCEVALF